MPNYLDRFANPFTALVQSCRVDAPQADASAGLHVHIPFYDVNNAEQGQQDVLVQPDGSVIDAATSAQLLPADLTRAGHLTTKATFDAALVAALAASNKLAPR